MPSTFTQTCFLSSKIIDICQLKENPIYFMLLKIFIVFTHHGVDTSKVITINTFIIFSENNVEDHHGLGEGGRWEVSQSANVISGSLCAALVMMGHTSGHMSGSIARGVLSLAKCPHVEGGERSGRPRNLFLGMAPLCHVPCHRDRLPLERRHCSAPLLL